MEPRIRWNPGCDGTQDPMEPRIRWNPGSDGTQDLYGHVVRGSRIQVSHLGSPARCLPSAATGSGSASRRGRALGTRGPPWAAPCAPQAPPSPRR
ncbi:MAG: hypothetical protein WDW38_002695 [Sanguina aurantia]